MKHGLIEGTRIAQIEETPFPVADPLYWVEVADDTTTRDTHENGAVVKEVVPAILVAASSISDRQFFQQLAIDGEITEAEALAAVATGTVPAALATVIAFLPPESQFAANMFLQGATTFERNHPMTQALAGLMGWDGSMLDALWTNAAAL